jgi:hypothetical protein
MTNPIYIIQDWAGNICFDGSYFSTFDDAEAFLSERLGDTYETDRQEYFITRQEY